MKFILFSLLICGVSVGYSADKKAMAEKQAAIAQKAARDAKDAQDVAKDKAKALAHSVKPSPSPSKK